MSPRQGLRAGHPEERAPSRRGLSLFCLLLPVGISNISFLPSAKCPESLELRCVRNLIVGTGATRVPAGAPVCIPGFSQAPSRQLSAALEQGFLSCLASLSSCPQWSKRLVRMTFSSAARSHGSVPREAVCLRPSR